MLSSNFNSNSYSYSSSTSVSASSSSGQHCSGHVYQKSTRSDPTGTFIQTTTQNLGELPVQETKYYTPDGNQVVDGGRVLGRGITNEVTGRIEDVSDENTDEENDRGYRKRIEDEYAKREGGA
ncbi:uncharacterized protein BP5553_03119 [Venustampulla echinocandica]|uniref:Uncharacterized protein n=1 Tax=Venustampulla echinocandica TaxID=2656787 RepID=A0A370TTB9_9HELO|nr:uncharacterized protein BP5553_03119 [Venustampulla echinocandica]RDL38779.1 hypothetical protein BP5553_03119 [Venustampulla echinocandica]